MTLQLLTNSCKHTCVGLLAGQQPIQCKYNSTAYDKLAKIAASAWWHAAALTLKLGKRAGEPLGFSCFGKPPNKKFTGVPWHVSPGRWCAYRTPRSTTGHRRLTLNEVRAVPRTPKAYLACDD